MSSNETPDEFAQIGSDEDVDAALQPKKTLNLPLATAILAGIVVLAIGLAGGAGLHAAFASNSSSNQPQAGRGLGGYGGFRGQNGGNGPGNVPGRVVAGPSARSSPRTTPSSSSRPSPAT
ncbi:MAG: hypothetical protein HOV66_10015 [Streptomycetaceae bacterium]|nr:hypothetical protein [Streptomycetaceae bacterium]